MDIMTVILKRLYAYKPVLKKRAEPFIIRSVSENIDKDFDAKTKNSIIIANKISSKKLIEVDATNCIIYTGKAESDFEQSAAGVIQLTETASKKELQNIIQDLIGDLLLIYQTKNNFYNVYTDNYRLTDLVNYAESLLGHPISIFNMSSEPIAMGNLFKEQLTNDAIIDEYQSRGFISVDFAQNNEFDAFFKTLNSSTEPFVFSYSKPDCILDRKVYPIRVADEMIAHCSVILTEPLSAIEDELLLYLCDLTVYDLQRNPIHIFSNSNDALVLKGLLSGKYQSMEDIEQNVDFSTFREMHTLYILTVRLDKSQASSSPGMLIRELIPLLGSDIKWSKHLLEPTRLIILINAKKTHVIFNNEEKLKDYFEKSNYLCAVSAPFTELTEFRSQYFQTEQLIETSLYLGQSVGFINGFSMFFSKVAYALRENGLDNYCLTQMLLLQKQHKHADLLFETVEAYIEEGFSSIRAAQKLNVHRNTVQRRLETFQELTGLSLESGRSICLIYFTLSLMHFKNRDVPYASFQTNP